MRWQPIPIAVSGMAGAALGFAAAVASLGSGTTASSASPLRPATEAGGSERRSVGGSEPGAVGQRASPEARDRADAGASPGANAEAEKRARVAELGTLRARERAAQAELSKARGRIVQLEKEIESDRPAGKARTRHEYDLTPEDWKEMAAEGKMKYRVPCAGQNRAPADANLAALGLAPEDYEVVREAYANSIARQEAALYPLCAAALGAQLDVEGVLNLDSCVTIVLSTAAQRSDNPAQSARNVAAFMAGDAPRPDENSPLTERAFLAFAEESKRFENELAAAFGPEEAHHITYSDLLCFARSSHSYGSKPNSPPPP